MSWDSPSGVVEFIPSWWGCQEWGCDWRGRFLNSGSIGKRLVAWPLTSQKVQFKGGGIRTRAVVYGATGGPGVMVPPALFILACTLGV